MGKKLGDLPRSEWISDVGVDVNGNAIISGGFKAESLTIGNTILTNSYSNSYDADLFIAAIDADGEWLWANSTQGTQYDNGDLVIFSGNTTGYVVGQTFGGISWGDNTDSSTHGGANQIFVGKFEFSKMIFDSDLDGVIDENDGCPETPLNTLVDQFGCPADFELINSDLGIGIGASLAINSLDDVFVSAPFYSAGSLKLLKLNNSNNVMNWDSEVVIPPTYRQYSHDSSLFIDSNDTPHLAFR